MKPELEEVLKLLALKEQTKQLYEQIDLLTKQMLDEFGSGRFDYELEDESKRFLKFELTDNVEKLRNDGVVFKAASFKPVSFSSGFLKRRPKSLKC